MQALSRLLPPSYVFENMRALVEGRGISLAGLAIAAALALAQLLAAGWIFTRTHRHALRTGLIARYAAETVS